MRAMSWRRLREREEDRVSYRVHELGKESLLFVSGENATVYNRYVDRFERRDGEWKIAARVVVLDLTRVEPATPPFGDVPGWNFTWGTRDKSDAVYRNGPLSS